jgi:hypothetical protein
LILCIGCAYSRFMAHRHRTPDEQKFWDEIFQDRFPVCMRSHRRSPHACAHKARDEADAALAERRRSIVEERGE